MSRELAGKRIAYGNRGNAPHKFAFSNGTTEEYEAIFKGKTIGKSMGHDLHNERGGYVRILDSKTKGKSCPECGTPIEKTQYLGGAIYFCQTL